MASMARESWTDERLDDLNGSVDAGFRDNREEFRAVRAEMKSEFQAVRAEVAAINRSVHQLTWSVVGAMLVGFLSVIATILAQT
jgi:hypothetical protein